MSIFKVTPTAELLDERAAGTMVEFLGIETHKIGEDFITMKMPVDHRTIQPLGLLHGGASAVLAESVGSLAANLCVDPKQQFCVGLDINANHIRAVREGWVFGTARPLHLGRTTQVWQIDIRNEKGHLTCISRLTMAVRERQ